jgi:aminomethyltransferase
LDRSASSSAVSFKDGTTALVSRTGYTGEIGFEIFCPAEQVVPLWETLLTEGESFGVTACGLAARDSLRAGAMLPLSHQDIGHWPFIDHPWAFALPFNQDRSGFTKNFIGDQALLKARGDFYTYGFAGFDPRKIALGETSVLDQKGQAIGTVLTCATDMGIGRHGGKIYSIISPDQPSDFKPGGLSCGFVRVNRKLSTGERVTIKDKRRTIEVETVADIRPARTARQRLKKFIHL